MVPCLVCLQTTKAWNGSKKTKGPGLLQHPDRFALLAHPCAKERRLSRRFQGLLLQLENQTQSSLHHYITIYITKLDPGSVIIPAQKSRLLEV